MTTERSYLLDELGDATAPIGSRLWSLYIANKIRVALYDTDQARQTARRNIVIFKKVEGYKSMGYAAWEEYCARRLGLSPEYVAELIGPEPQDRPLIPTKAGKPGAKAK